MSCNHYSSSVPTPEYLTPPFSTVRLNKFRVENAGSQLTAHEGSDSFAETQNDARSHLLNYKFMEGPAHIGENLHFPTHVCLAPRASKN